MFSSMFSKVLKIARPDKTDSLCTRGKDGTPTNHEMHAKAMGKSSDEACNAYAKSLLGDRAKRYGPLFTNE